MEDAILFLVLLLILLMSSFFTIKSLIKQIKIRKAIRTNKVLLSQMRDKNEDGKYHTYNNLLHYTLLNLRGKIKNLPQEKLQVIVDKEISNLSGGYVRRFISGTWVILKFAFSIVFVFMSFMFAVIVVDEFQAAEDTQQVDTISADNIEKDVEPNASDLEKNNNEQSTAQETISNKDKQIYEEALAAYNEGRTEEAIKAFNNIKKKSEYYKEAQEVLAAIEKEMYWNSVSYPTYLEITKSPEDFTGGIVGFSGKVIDIVEHNGKTMMIIGTEIVNEYHQQYGGDILVLYGERTDYMEGDMLSITGTMKGSYIQTEQEALIGSYLNSATSFSTTGFENISQMPVIIADYLY